MAELYSFFLKASIKPESFQKFLDARPLRPQPDQQWADWWNGADMYNKKNLESSDLRPYDEADNKSIVDNWLKRRDSFCFSEYNTNNHVWHFVVPFFSENYYEMIPMIAFGKSVAQYREGDASDFILIFSPLQGNEDDVPAFLKFDKEDAVFNNKPGSGDLKYASGIIYSKMAEQGGFDDE